jgi:thiosulfate reductase cytochrome b subunit
MDSVQLSATPSVSATQAAPKEVIYRHSRVVRIAHWINALCFLMLLMSGLQIFNAHPFLYWGQKGANYDRAFLEIGAVRGNAGEWRGVTRLGDTVLDTTGVLGASTVKGQPNLVAFPAWMTVPSWRDLAAGRRWHFFFAWALVLNGLAYLGLGFANRHFSRDIVPKGNELKPRHILKDIWDHVRLKHPTGEAAKHYNTLQKLSYVAVIFILFPLMILTGLTMSPGFNSILPALLDLFGGRQSARSIHFIAANLLVLFLIVHLVEVVIAGAWNEIRSMITGRYVVRRDKAEPALPAAGEAKS